MPAEISKNIAQHQAGERPPEVGGLDHDRRCPQAREPETWLQLLQGVYDHVLEAILLADDEGQYIDANPAVCALTGYGHAENDSLPIAGHLGRTPYAVNPQLTPVLDPLRRYAIEPFFTTKSPGIGTVLGLSLCRGIIEGHGGTSSVKSQPGQGTVFSLELPLESGGNAKPDASRDAVWSSNPARSAMILVIDDEPGIASALVHILSRSGHEVETAANGRLALAKLLERTFDLILCDLRMPELDGPGFYHEVAQRYPQLLPRIIFLTGDTLRPEARAFLEQVGVARLHKPFRAAEVRRIVHQVLQTL
jgi:CheY-like chemotaxis protein